MVRIILGAKICSSDVAAQRKDIVSSADANKFDNLPLVPVLSFLNFKDNLSVAATCNAGLQAVEAHYKHLLAVVKGPDNRNVDDTFEERLRSINGRPRPSFRLLCKRLGKVPLKTFKDVWEPGVYSSFNLSPSHKRIAVRLDSTEMIRSQDITIFDADTKARIASLHQKEFPLHNSEEKAFFYNVFSLDDSKVAIYCASDDKSNDGIWIYLWDHASSKLEEICALELGFKFDIDYDYILSRPLKFKNDFVFLTKWKDTVQWRSFYNTSVKFLCNLEHQSEKIEVCGIAHQRFLVFQIRSIDGSRYINYVYDLEAQTMVDSLRWVITEVNQKWGKSLVAVQDDPNTFCALDTCRLLVESYHIDPCTGKISTSVLLKIDETFCPELEDEWYGNQAERLEYMELEAVTTKEVVISMDGIEVHDLRVDNECSRPRSICRNARFLGLSTKRNELYLGNMKTSEVCAHVLSLPA